MSPTEPSTPVPLADAAPPPGQGGESHELGTLGMWILLASLSMIFAATIAGYFWTRSNAETWPPPGTPPLPVGLWLSTAILLISSGSMSWASRSVGKNRQGDLRWALGVTTILGLAFLVCQGFNWYWLVQQHFTVRSHLTAFLFYFLTGLHAAHVIGGVIPLGIVTAKAFRGEYSSVFYPGVKYCAMYWHFLDVIWVVLFVMLLATF